MDHFRIGYKSSQIYEDTYSIADLVWIKAPFICTFSCEMRKRCLSLTSKDVICACTYGHIDHALGAYQFEKAFLHSHDFALYQLHSSPDFVRASAYMGVVRKMSKRKAKNPSYINLVERVPNISRKELMPLDQVEKFDLGGRTVSWLLLQGHTQGSVVFIDEKYHTVFDSDEAPNEVWLFLPESSSIQDYRENLI